MGFSPLGIVGQRTHCRLFSWAAGELFRVTSFALISWAGRVASVTRQALIHRGGGKFGAHGIRLVPGVGMAGDTTPSGSDDFLMAHSCIAGSNNVVEQAVMARQAVVFVDKRRLLRRFSKRF